MANYNRHARRQQAAGRLNKPAGLSGLKPCEDEPLPAGDIWAARLEKPITSLLSSARPEGLVMMLGVVSAM
jgi:hypothetical protein